MKIRMAFRLTMLVKYARGITAATLPNGSVATIQELRSAVIGMSESAASSLGDDGG